MTAARKIHLFSPDCAPAPPGELIRSCTVAELVAWFDATFPPGHSVEAETECLRVRALFVAAFGTRPAAAITPREFDAWLSQQPGVKANNTRHRWLRTIQRPFREAASLNLIPRNPLAACKVPAGKSGRDWTLGEFRALMRGSPLHFRRLLVFVRYAGPRGGEVAGARWDQVDWEQGLLIQEQHKTVATTGEPRVIVLNRVTRRILELIRHEQKERPSRVIFLNSFSQPWQPKSMRKYFRQLRHRLGLREDVKLHGGRHLFGTSSILAGNDVASTAVLLGHKSLQTTQRYLHLVNKRDHAKAAAERLAAR